MTAIATAVMVVALGIAKLVSVAVLAATLKAVAFDVAALAVIVQQL